MVETHKPGDACPTCTKPLKLRYRKMDNLPFLGCTGFPDCRYTEPYPEGPAPAVAKAAAPLPPPPVVLQGLELNEAECSRLLDMAHGGLHNNKDTLMLDLISKVEDYYTRVYRKNKQKLKVPVKGLNKADTEAVEF